MGPHRSILFVNPTLSVVLKVGHMPAINHKNDNRTSPFVLAQITGRREL